MDYMLSREDHCQAILDYLSLDFLGPYEKEEKIAEKQFLQNKCDVRQMEEY